MIEKRMEGESDLVAFRELRSVLAMEHEREGNYAAAEAIHLRSSKRTRTTRCH